MALLGSVIILQLCSVMPWTIQQQQMPETGGESEISDQGVVWKWGILPAFTLKKPLTSTPSPVPALSSTTPPSGNFISPTPCLITSPPTTRLPPIQSHGQCFTCPPRIPHRAEVDSEDLDCPLFINSHNKMPSYFHAKDKTKTVNNNGLVMGKWIASNSKSEKQRNSIVCSNPSKPIRLPAVAPVPRSILRPPTYIPAHRPLAVVFVNLPRNQVDANVEVVASSERTNVNNVTREGSFAAASSPSSPASGTNLDMDATPTQLSSPDRLLTSPSPQPEAPQATQTTDSELGQEFTRTAKTQESGEDAEAAAKAVDPLNEQQQQENPNSTMLRPAEQRMFTSRAHLVANLVQTFNAKSASSSPVKQCSLASPPKCLVSARTSFVPIAASRVGQDDEEYEEDEEVVTEIEAVVPHRQEKEGLDDIQEQLINQVYDDGAVMVDVEETLEEFEFIEDEQEEEEEQVAEVEEDETEEEQVEEVDDSEAESSGLSCDSIEEVQELQDKPMGPTDAVADLVSQDTTDGEYREPRRRSGRFLTESFNSGNAKDMLGSSLSSNYFHDYQREITSSPAKIRSPSVLSPIPPAVDYPEKVYDEKSGKTSPVLQLAHSTKRKLAKLNINQRQTQDNTWDQVIEEDIDPQSPPPVRMQHSPVLPRSSPMSPSDWSPPPVHVQPIKRSSTMSIKTETNRTRKPAVHTARSTTSSYTKTPSAASSSVSLKPSPVGGKTTLNQTRTRLSQTPTRKSFATGTPLQSSSSGKASLSKTFVLNNNSTASSDPQQMLQTAMKNLQNEEWEVEMDGIQSVARLAVYHTDVLLSQLHAVNLLMINQVKNLRSQVCRAAIQTFGLLFEHMGKNMEPDMDKAAALLFLKTGDTNKFIREDSNIALDAMVEHVTPAKAMCIMVSEGANHKNGSVRTTAARLLANLVEKMGAAKTLKDMADKLLPTAAQLLQDGSQETRNYAKKMFAILVQDANFDKLLERHLQTTVLRNVEKTINSIKTNGLNATHRAKPGSRFNATI